MRIAIIGSGNIGGNIGLRAAQAGHAVTFSHSRDPAKLDALARKAGDASTAASVEEAAARSEIVVLSVPWVAREDAIPDPSILSGKLVVDTTNQYGSDGVLDLGGATAATLNVRWLRGARISKAFNTLTSQFQVEEGGRPEADRHAMFHAGEDASASAAAEQLIEAVGFVPIHLGGWDVVGLMEPPRREGSVYGEAYRADDARRIAQAAASDPDEARRLARELKLAG